jgi:hypothetical protein
MKKLAIMLGAAALFMLSGCERDWVCTCTDQNGNITNHTINNELLINASSKCRAMGYSYTENGVTVSEDCKLQ